MSDDELKALVQAQMTGGPQPDDEYLHYKGGRYVIVARALREDTLEPVVIYRSLAKGFVWERTLVVFTEMVERDGVTVPRFMKMPRSTANSKCSWIYNHWVNLLPIG